MDNEQTPFDPDEDFIDWLHPGAEVAVVEFYGFGQTPWVTFSVVDRVLKRDVVLKHAYRFVKTSPFIYNSSPDAIRGLQMPSKNKWSTGARPILLRANDPLVDGFLAKEAEHKEWVDLRTKMEKWITSQGADDDVLAQIASKAGERVARRTR